MERSWGFKCNCPRCEQEASCLTPDTARRLLWLWRCVDSDVTPVAAQLLDGPVVSGNWCKARCERVEAAAERPQVAQQLAAKWKRAAGEEDRQDRQEFGYPIEAEMEMGGVEAEAWVESVLGGPLAAAAEVLAGGCTLAEGSVEVSTGASTAPDAVVAAGAAGGEQGQGDEEAELLGGAFGALAQLAAALDILTEEVRGRVARDVAEAAAAAASTLCGAEYNQQQHGEDQARAPPGLLADLPLQQHVHQNQEQQQQEQQQLKWQQEQQQQQEEVVHQVCYAMLEAVQLSAACHEVLCVALLRHAGGGAAVGSMP